MKYRLLITNSATKDLRSLAKDDSTRIVEKLRYIMKQSSPLKYAKKLKNPRLGTYRFRVGDYRIIFDIDKKGNINILYILRIKHRKEVYDK